MKILLVTLGEKLGLAMEILNYVAIIFDVILLLCFSWFYIYYIVNGFMKEKAVKIVSPKFSFAVFIPARNESKVIKNILDSLKKQEYPTSLFDVYVIVENFNDPTIKIVKKYGSNFHVVVRKNIGKKRTKGFALDDGYKHIVKSGKSFDAIVVFDADNIASSDYLLTLNAIKNEGYQIGVGYRNFTNINSNWISLTSAILFSFINCFSSRGKTKLFKKANLTGTGYFIDKKIVDDAGGWIWNGMTEDVELTHYAYLNNIKMKYYSKVEYFDEQATDRKTLRNQHIRWVWGFFSSDKNKSKNKKFDYDNSLSKFRKTLSKIEHKLSVYPFIFFLILEVIIFVIDFILGFICLAINAEQYVINNAFIFGSYHLLVAYLILALVGLLTILVDNHNLKLNFKQILLATLTYPLLFLDFVFAFFEGLFNKQKRTNWKVIEHKGEVSNFKAKLSKEGK